MQRIQELSPLELVEMFVTVFCFLKDSSEVSQTLLDDFRSCQGYGYLTEFLLRYGCLELSKWYRIAGNFCWVLIFVISRTVYGVGKIKTANIYSNRNLFCQIWYRFTGYSNIEWHRNFNDVWYHIRGLPFIYSFQVDYVQESPSSVIIIV